MYSRETDCPRISSSRPHALWTHLDRGGEAGRRIWTRRRRRGNVFLASSALTTRKGGRVSPDRETQPAGRSSRRSRNLRARALCPILIMWSKGGRQVYGALARRHGNGPPVT